MPTPVEIFDELAFSQWQSGPRYFPILQEETQAFEVFRKRAEWFISFSRRQPELRGLPEIYFDYLATPELQAIADCVNDRGFIAICRGAILLTHDMFHRMLADPDALPRIGNPRAETLKNPPQPLFASFTEYENHRADLGLPRYALRANDKDREAFAVLLIGLAFDFLLFHEMGHILYGHCDYHRSLTGQSAIRDLSARSSLISPIPDALTYQAIEMEADIHATLASLSHALDRPIDQWAIGVRQFVQTPEQRLFAWSFAVQAVVYHWGIDIDHHTLKKELEEGDHPHPALRYFQISHWAEKTIEKVYPEHTVEWKRAEADAHVQLWKSLTVVGSGFTKDQITNMVKANLDPMTQSHLVKLKEHLRTLRPKLEQFRRIKTQMPDMDSAHA